MILNFFLASMWMVLPEGKWRARWSPLSQERGWQPLLGEMRGWCSGGEKSEGRWGHEERRSSGCCDMSTLQACRNEVQFSIFLSWWNMVIVHMYIQKIIKLTLEIAMEKSWPRNHLELCPEYAVFIRVLWSCPRGTSAPHLPGGPACLHRVGKGWDSFFCSGWA